MSAVLERNAHVHPIMAAILNAASDAPIDLERAAYVARLRKMDWQFEFADGSAWRRGKDELHALRTLQVDLDPLAVLWNKHAPFEFMVHAYTKVVITNPGQEPSTQWIRSDMPTLDLSLHLMERNNVFGAKIEIKAEAPFRQPGQAA